MHSYRPIRRAMAGLVVAVASTALLLVPASVAQAHGGNLVCVGQSTSSYRPGMANLPRDVTVTQWGVAGPCVSTSHPQITSGTWKLVANGTLSCVSGSASGTRTFYWNDGTSSVERVRLTISARPEGQTVLVTEGQIVGGQFAGTATSTQAVQLSTELLACDTPEGVTSTAGPRVIEIL